jgi:hypothetical protein
LPFPVASYDGDGRQLAAGKAQAPGDPHSIAAVAVDERFERAAQFGGKIFFADRSQQRDGRLIGLELGHAPRARGKVTLELCMNVSRQVMLDEVRQKADEVGAGALGQFVAAPSSALKRPAGGAPTSPPGLTPSATGDV